MASPDGNMEPVRLRRGLRIGLMVFGAGVIAGGLFVLGTKLYRQYY